MHASNPQRVSMLLGAVCALGLSALPATAQAPKSFPDQFQEKWESAGPNVRIKRHQDGSRTQFQRTRDDTTLVKRTFGASTNGKSVLLKVAVYRLGPNGDPIACKIFDGRKTLLYKVAYGFDPKTGRLRAEKMYDARTRRIDPNNPRQEQPVRVMYRCYLLIL